MYMYIHIYIHIYVDSEEIAYEWGLKDLMQRSWCMALWLRARNGLHTDGRAMFQSFEMQLPQDLSLRFRARVVVS